MAKGSRGGKYGSGNPQLEEIRKSFPYAENVQQLETRLSEIEESLSKTTSKKKLMSIANEISSLRNFSIPMQRGARESLHESSEYLDAAEKKLGELEKKLISKYSKK